MFWFEVITFLAASRITCSALDIDSAKRFLFLHAEWSTWSACTTSCGVGYRYRHQTCHYLHVGYQCKSETEACEAQLCPLKVPDHWSQWSSCSATCGNGESVRHWICTTHTTLIGKRSTCTEKLERLTCSSGSCPIDGNWNSWSEFSKCTVSCGLGTQIRSRSCSNPAPSNGGLECLGSSMEAIVCSLPACIENHHVCDKVRLFSSIFHNTSVSQNGDTSCPDRSYHSSRALIQELCQAPYTSLHFGSRVIDVCTQIPTFTPVGKTDDITGHIDYGILIECNGNRLKVGFQDCNSNVHILDLGGTESDMYHVVNW